jgi:PAS domain S-box-containing protein
MATQRNKASPLTTGAWVGIDPRGGAVGRRRLLIRAGYWTACIAACVALALVQIHRQQRAIAEFVARASYHKDLVYRQWVSERGGVYVPNDGKTPPNPYLAHLPDRDIVGSNGVHYTLVNPAYMTRMVHELGASEYGYRGHLTSLDPIRPENAPDPWEAAVLRRFAAGEREVASEAIIDGRPYMRFMGAFIVQPGCLRCHAHQGYRVGDVRGGISVSLPLTSEHLRNGRRLQSQTLALLSLVWAVGIMGLVLFGRRERRVERRAEQAIELRHAVFRASGVGMLLASPDGQILDANPKLLAMLGHAEADLYGRHLRDILDPALDFAAFAKQNRIFDPAGATILECALPSTTGRPAWCTVNIGPLHPEHPARGFLWTFTDTGDLRNAQECLEVINQELLAARDQAVGAARVKSEFLANMSHEIRTPLHGILGMAEILAKTPLSPDQAEYVAAIRDSGDGLLVVLNDVLDFSKMEAGQLQLETLPFSLADEAKAVVTLFRAQIDPARVRLTLQIGAQLPAQVRGDATRFRQILSNLVNNAVKFTPEGRITVSLEGEIQRNQRCHARVVVADTGIGIPREKQDRLFLPFSQADSSTARRFGGTGLGLMLVKRLTQAMGGVVSFQSAVNQGSTFQVDLSFDPVTEGREAETPAPAPAPGAPLEDVPAAPPRKPATILIAEDVLVNQLVARKLVESFGATPRIVANGREAVAAVQAGGIDLILMDCQMPEMDGFQATEAIRAGERETGAHLPIIAMTAGAMAEDRQHCLDAGMDDYISKPVTSEALHRCIQQWLGKA